MTMRLSIIISVFLFLSSSLSAQTTVGEYYQSANKAFEEKDYPTFLAHLEKANELRPNHRTILYNLAVAQTLNQQFEKAIETLEYRASFYVVNDFDKDIPVKISL